MSTQSHNFPDIRSIDALTRQLVAIAFDRKDAVAAHARATAKQMEAQARDVRQGRRAHIDRSDLPPLTLDRFDKEAHRILAGIRAAGGCKDIIANTLAFARRVTADPTWLAGAGGAR